MSSDSHLLLWSGDQASALLTDIEAALEPIPDDAEALEYVARSSQLTFNPQQNCRLALVANSLPKLRQQLEHCRSAILQAPEQAHHSPKGWHYGYGRQSEGKTALLFPGQGSQYLNMGAQLCMTFAPAREVWDMAAGLELTTDANLAQRVFPPPVFSDEQRQQQSGALNATEWAQPAIGATSLSQWALLKAMGLTVDGVAGHSYGELTALHVAGAFDQATLLSLARKRGELMAQAAQKKAGAMSAVSADRDTVQALLAKLDNSDVVIANVNSPRQIVISGSEAAIAQAEQAATEQGLPYSRLPVATAFHSPIVAAALAPFSAHLSATEFAPLQMPVYANVTARPYSADSQQQKDCLAQQLASPVLFMEQIQAMQQDGFNTFIEVGPGTVLSNLTSACLKDTAHTAVALDRKNRDGLHSLWQALAQLSVLGKELDYSALWQGFREYPNPAERPQGKMSVPITGINYNRVYPPEGGTSALPAANAHDSETPVIERENTVSAPDTATTTPEATHAQRQASPDNQASMAPSSAPATAVALASVRTEPEPTAAASAWLSAFENIQRQTHEAHRQFLQLSETALAQLHQLLPQAGAGTHGTEMPSAHIASPQAPLAASIAPAPVTPSGSAQVAASRATPADNLPRESEAGSQHASSSVPAQPVQNIPASAPAIEPAPAASVDVNAVMLEIVGEKTGYPLEMLTLDMDLENDLGIDSIKRVEILSAAIERVPDLPELNPGDMAALRTLQEVTDFISAQLGGRAAAAKPEPTGNLSTAAINDAAPVPTRTLDTAAVNQLLLTIVAEKTGYPAEMLDPAMDLENDLGVDSIKRVEILSSAIEQVPELPALEPAAMADLRTLGDVAGYIAGQLTSAAPAINPTPTPPGPTSDGSVSAAGVEQLMIAVVAEKTGYPIDMLEAGMDLENDLGIDSIKRVEILAATTEQVDNMPPVDAADMAALRTLGDVARYIEQQLQQQSGANTVATAVTSESPVSTPAADIDVERLMLEVVAEKTGYPIDMLEAGMDLENDLGIDSIKRVEILAATTERVDNMPPVDAADMAALRTLGDVAQYISGQLHQAHGQAAAEVSAVTATPAANTPRSDIHRFALKLLPMPAPGLTPEALQRAQHIVVTPDDTAVAKAVAKALQQRGLEVTLSKAPSADDRHVICLEGLNSMDSISQASATNAIVFNHACTVAASQERDGGLFIVVQSTGGDYSLRQRVFTADDAIRAWSGGLSGLAKTASQEWPKSLVRSIDLASEGGDAQSQARAIVEELFAGAAQVEVALSSDGQRLVPVTTEAAAQPGTLPLAEHDVVVVSGGARGVTAAAINTLCQAQPLRIALLGRTPLDSTDAYEGISEEPALMQAVLSTSKAEGQALSPPALKTAVAAILGQREIRATLQAIEASGSQAIYLNCDINSQGSLNDALDTVRKQWGRIDALVHGAGVLADKLLSAKTAEHFQRVFGTKIDGLQHLLNASANDRLKVLCLFSSVAARTGNAGQSDYAMANEVLNRVAAVYQANTDAKVVSINWGPWDSGMVNAALKQKFSELGVALIPLAEGAQRFVDELCHPAGQDSEVVIGGGALHRPLTRPDDRRSYRFTVSADPAQLPHLDSHRVRGNVVLPMVQVVDWFSAAANSISASAQDLLISDLRVLQGITLEQDRPQQLLIELAESTDAGTFNLLLIDQQGRKRYSASARFSDSSERRAQPHATERTPVASDFDPYAERLFHGPLFAAVEQIEGIDQSGASARLRSGQQLAWQDSGWHVDQALLDGALQLALLWGYQQTGNDTLPLSFTQMRIGHRGLHGKSARCTLQGTSNNASGTQSDLWIYDDDDQFIASIDGLQMFAVSESLQ